MSMIEKPILFNSEMVRAILDGRKTQTRRPMKPQPEIRENESLPGKFGTFFNGWNLDHELVSADDIIECSPFGRPGGRLWVRETSRGNMDDDSERCGVEYRADGYLGHRMDSYLKSEGSEQFRKLVLYRTESFRQLQQNGFGNIVGNWVPSIHMPRWASRINLLVKRVWVERVREISEFDAQAEGIAIPEEEGQPYCWMCRGSGWRMTSSGTETECRCILAHFGSFASLWDSIYASKDLGWDDNPWVWACEFDPVNESPKR